MRAQQYASRELDQLERDRRARLSNAPFDHMNLTPGGDHGQPAGQPEEWNYPNPNWPDADEGRNDEPDDDPDEIPDDFPFGGGGGGGGGNGGGNGGGGNGGGNGGGGNGGNNGNNGGNQYNFGRRNPFSDLIE